MNEISPCKQSEKYMTPYFEKFRDYAPFK